MHTLSLYDLDFFRYKNKINFFVLVDQFSGFLELLKQTENAFLTMFNIESIPLYCGLSVSLKTLLREAVKKKKHDIL